MDQATAGQIQNQNQRQPQSNRQAVPATGNSQPDELKGLGMMMQQLLQGMQIQGKALNQVSTDINTRMDNMFTELNTKCMTSRHTRRNARGELVTLTNQDLTRLERTNPTDATVAVDHSSAGTSCSTAAGTAGTDSTGNSQPDELKGLGMMMQQLLQATGNSQPDELKGLGMMMQQLLQGMQIQGKALNQVSTDINTRMDNMFTELNTKYDAVSNHIKRIDVQLAQTAESVKRQQCTLPGKSVMNPRVEHCNAAELRCEKAEGKEPEQLSAKTAPGAEERTGQHASSEVTASDEPIEIPPVRLYVSKVLYPIPPKHLMDPISAEQLAGFKKMGEIKALFTEALTPSLKVLPKVVDPGKFIFPCSLAGVEFKEALCDSRSSVNLVSKAIVDELSIVDVEPSLVTLDFVNSSMTVPYSTIRNLPVQVGNCILHTEFQVVEMSKDHEMALIFGRSFMDTVGVVVDMPNKRVSFSNINKKVFYKGFPTRSQICYASCISVVSGEQLEIVPKKELGKKGEMQEVLDGDPHTDTKKLSGNARVKEKVQKKRVKGDPMITLIPRLCDEKSIEYEVKCKDTSKPFSKARGKALNQVSTDINTRMDNMFTELNTKYDAVSNHIKRIDVHLAQTAESVKRQQCTLPGKSVMNPRVEHCNAAELICEKAGGKEPEQLSAKTAPGAEERTEQHASSEVTASDEPIEIPPVRVYVSKVLYPIQPKHLMDPISAEQLAGFKKMELGKKGEIQEVLDGDPHTDTKKLSGNARVKEKVQKKRVKGDPMITLIPRLCDEKSIEYEVKCKDTSKPFSKARVILTHELKEKGEADVKGLLSRVAATEQLAL
ncbi:hypothetical protein F2Q69_00031070 [Brassica cretica]|uniref:Aspartic peptidase DDI1-type domain-containing protein n=1 Tax=Brassica cretica TaxID=69181 RepID=A0A8S9S9N0_BRACR|nr:hypothetical protein F2Q69_00031070 [Brassica cretica]